MPELELDAEPREVLGKRVARLRRAGVTPANIIGHRIPSQAIQVPTLALSTTLRQARGTHLVRLRVAGEAAPRMVLVRHVSRKPTNDLLLHVDFYQVSMTEKTVVEIPIVLTGTSPAVENGGTLLQQLSTLTVECLPGDIPNRIEMDISGLTEDHPRLHIADLRLPPNVTATEPPDEVVVTVVAESAAEAEAAPAAAEAETASETSPEAP